MGARADRWTTVLAGLALLVVAASAFSSPARIVKKPAFEVPSAATDIGSTNSSGYTLKRVVWVRLQWNAASGVYDVSRADASSATQSLELAQAHTGCAGPMAACSAQTVTLRGSILDAAQISLAAGPVVVCDAARSPFSIPLNGGDGRRRRGGAVRSSQASRAKKLARLEVLEAQVELAADGRSIERLNLGTSVYERDMTPPAVSEVTPSPTSVPAAAAPPTRELRIQVDQPLLARPPDSCAAIPKPSPLVATGALRRIRLVLEPGIGYRASSSSCESGGISDADLRGARIAGAPIRWEDMSTLMISRQAALPDGFSLEVHAGPTLAGTESIDGPDVSIALAADAAGTSRTGHASRRTSLRIDPVTGKVQLALQVIAATASRNNKEEEYCRAIDVRDFTYLIDPPEQPCTVEYTSSACPPVGCSSHLVFDSTSALQAAGYCIGPLEAPVMTTSTESRPGAACSEAPGCTRTYTRVATTQSIDRSANILAGCQGTPQLAIVTHEELFSVSYVFESVQCEPPTPTPTPPPGQALPPPPVFSCPETPIETNTPPIDLGTLIINNPQEPCQTGSDLPEQFNFTGTDVQELVCYYFRNSRINTAHLEGLVRSGAVGPDAVLFEDHYRQSYVQTHFITLYPVLTQTTDGEGRIVCAAPEGFATRRTRTVVTLSHQRILRVPRTICDLLPNVPGCPCTTPPQVQMAVSPLSDPSGRICAPSGSPAVTLEALPQSQSPPRSLTYSWSVASSAAGEQLAQGRVVSLSLPRARYTATLTARDDSGGCTASVSRTFFVDGPPTAQITKPSEGAVLSTTSRITISATAEDQESSPQEPLSVKWRIYDLDRAPNAPFHLVDQGSFGAPEVGFRVLPGAYRAELTVEDTCGHTFTATRNFSVVEEEGCTPDSLALGDAATSGLPGTTMTKAATESGGHIPLPPAAAASPPHSDCLNCVGCEGGGCGTGLVGDPVFIATGEFFDEHLHFGWATPSGRLTFKRAYRSNRASAGQLGAGWSHNFESRLEDSPDGATIVDWRGSALFFPRTGAGGFARPQLGGVSLEREASGEWVVRHEAGGSARYTPDGRLAQLADSHGNTTTMVYSPAGDLARVVDPAGGALELEVSDGLLRAATAKNGDRVQFAYTADRRLAGSTSHDGHATVYGYAPGTGLLSAIQRPGTGGGVYTQRIEYNGAQQVTRVASTAEDGTESATLLAYPTRTARAMTAADGKVYSFKVGSHGQLVERVDPNGDTYSLETDGAGRTTRRSFPDGSSESWAYDAQGRIASYISRLNEVMRVERDSTTGFPITLIRVNGTREEREERTFSETGSLRTSKTATGELTTYTRDGRGLVTAITGPGGGTTRTEYDANGFVTKVTDELGQSTTIQHDSLGRVIAVTSPGGRTTRTEHCSCGSVSASIDAEGNRTEYEYGAAGELLKTKLPDGGVIEYTYVRRNGQLLVASVKDAMGGVSRTEYDLVGRATAHVDALDRRTTYELDVIGRVVKVNLPGGNFSITRYNQAGRVSETENARGAKTTFTYDADGRLLTTTNHDGATSSQEFDGVGRVVKRISADGAVEQLVYDAAGRVIATIDAFGKISQTQYGPSGVVTKTVNARGKATTFEHDVLDRVVKTTNALGFSSRQQYSPDGEVVLTVNARGAETRFAFDRNGRLIETTDPVGGKVKKGYDSMGNLTRVEDERGHAWTFAHDRNQRRIRETDPLGRTTHYIFNALELVEVRHADGSSWHYLHDDAGRVKSRILKDKNGRVEDIESFEHDLVGNRIKAENNAVVVTSTYDLLDRELTRKTVWKKTAAVRELTFSWDVMGRRRMMVDSHGRGVGYEYDKLSRPVKLTVLDPNPHATGIADAFFPREYTFTWDDVSNLVEVKYPNGTRTRRLHDDIDRLTKLVHERDGYTLASWTIDRDPQGNPTKIVREDGEIWTMDHDLGDRLTRVALPRSLVARLRAKDPAKGGGKPEREDDDDEDAAEKLMRVGEVVYRYDAAHNRTEEVYGGRVVRSTFDLANQMLTRGSMSFKYNERGDQVEKLHKSGRREVFSYSAAGKLASYATGHQNSRHLKEIERYVYSPSSERVLVEDVQDKKLLHALWDGHRPIDEWSERGQGGGKKDKGELFVRDLGGQLLESAKYTRRAGRSKHECEDDDWDEWDDDEDRRDGPGAGKAKLKHVRFFHPDFLTSTALVTNHRGRALARPEYGPWGEPLHQNEKVRYGYTGHSFEPKLGMWGAMHRYLDPRQGRWTQNDPLGDAGGQNRYAYVHDGPITSIDPHGLLDISTPLGIFRATLRDFYISKGSITNGFDAGGFNFKLRVTDKTKACSFAFLQVATTTVDGKAFAIKDEIKKYWILPSGIHIDPAEGKIGSEVYYSQHSANPTQPGYESEEGMQDSPALPVSYIKSTASGTFQSVIIVKAGPLKGKIIGGVEWGFSYESGKKPLTKHPTLSRDLRRLKIALGAYLREYPHLSDPDLVALPELW